MEKLHQHLIFAADGKAAEGNTYTEGSVRVTVLTPRLLRCEFSKSGVFTNEPTQSIFYRNLGAVTFSRQKKEGMLCIDTGKAVFSIRLDNGNVCAVALDGKTIHPNKKHNLKGTARTLDMSFGAVPLNNGVISSDGVALLDDSASLLFCEDGTVKPRSIPEKDVYVFAYGKDYIGALQDFYRLTGSVPLIPRFALGNWWSRYKAYTQEEYTDVIRAFKAHDIPLSVATIDMDWHWVNLKNKFGKENLSAARGGANGWTGYSWNTDLFPDHKAFLEYLHKENLKITLNLHPADGIRWYEDCYEEAAKRMGIDPATKAPVPFDVSNSQFLNTYFDCAHHPLEEEGVDFWWMDWQQGTKSSVEGLDPLWSLNHYHYLDNARNGKRPMNLSRYSGIGAHRYPLGFSGDTQMSWRVLDFQPYFTITAANCGYTWWSHDIGGHQMGVHDDELYVRWVQFGVFSPILRLHSTSNDLFGKEPWRYSHIAENVVADFMRFRHQLIPYLYTMNARTHREGRALCEPLYYTYPESQEAYNCKNGYFFGTELLVCPVTTKINSNAKTACTKVFLPKGTWTNLFTGRRYIGGKTVRVHSELDELPVFAREGAILPLSLDGGNGTENPKHMEVRIYRGNHAFTLYEDDGETLAFENGDYVETEMKVKTEARTLTFTLSGAKAADYLPKKRQYAFAFCDILSAKEISVSAQGKEIPYKAITAKDGTLRIEIAALPIETALTITLTDIKEKENPSFKEEILRIFTRFSGNNNMKTVLYMPFKQTKTRASAIALAKSLPSGALRSELLEVLEDME